MSISITLPDDAQPHELAAAAQFFHTLAAAHDGGSEVSFRVPADEKDFAAQLQGELSKALYPARSTKPQIQGGPAKLHNVPKVTTSPEESTAVAQAVTTALTPPVDDAAAAALAFQPPGQEITDVPDFSAPPPVPPVPPPMITAEAAAAGLPSAPPVPQPPTTGPAGQELDRDGLPWDKRIHSGGENKKNADGRWRKRKGLNDPAMVQRIEAELRAALSAPAAPVAPPVPQPPAAPPVPFVPPPAQNAAPQAGESPSTPPAGSAPLTFTGLMPLIGPHLSSKRITQEHINAAMAEHGMPPGLPLLAQRPDLVPGVYGAIMRLAGLQ